MSSTYDVMTELAGLLAQIVYPEGTANPSITGSDIIVYPGWPNPDTLDVDLPSGKSHISVFGLRGGQNTTRYPIQQQNISTSEATLSWKVGETTATLVGTVSTPQNVALIVDGIGYAYAVLPTDTLTSIAAALAALVAVNQPCTSSGAVITMPTASSIVARVGTVSVVAAEWARQKKRFQITVWCNTPQNRATIVDAIQPALAQQHFMTMPDGFAARLRFYDDTPIDDKQKYLLYRHDLFYEVEFAITVTTTAPQAIVWTVEVFGGVIPPTTSPQIFNF